MSAVLCTRVSLYTAVSVVVPPSSLPMRHESALCEKKGGPPQSRLFSFWQRSGCQITAEGHGPDAHLALLCPAPLPTMSFGASTYPSIVSCGDAKSRSRGANTSGKGFGRVEGVLCAGECFIFRGIQKIWDQSILPLFSILDAVGQ